MVLLCFTGQVDPPATDGAAAAVEGKAKAQIAAGKRPRDDADESEAGPSHRSRKDESGEDPTDEDQGKEQRRNTEGAGGSSRHRGEEGAEVEDEEEWDVTAGMNPRQKKLYLLQRKAAKARKANEHAAVAEAKRVRAGPANTHLERKKWLDKQKKEKEVCSSSLQQHCTVMLLTVNTGHSQQRHFLHLS